VNKLPQFLIAIGIVFITISLIVFISIFAPVAKVELNYNLDKPQVKINEIKPVDKDFGIVIPKIGANSKVIEGVDPFNASVYQLALTKGVAQAKGTAKPDEIGSMFLFSHSSTNLLEATRYNSIFYLLSKLQKNDEIYIYYKSVKYKYVVSETKMVDAKDVSYLNPKAQGKSLILMTCWPPGTTFQRLLVFATEK